LEEKLKLLKYITIEPYEDLPDAKAKIKRELGTLNFIVLQTPHKLAGNYKVLQLSSRANIENVVKVDGPGFLIDELFEFFTSR
jgi:hypothetical protein